MFVKLDFYDYQPAVGVLAEHSCLSEDSHLHKWRLFPITSYYKTSKASDKMETFKYSISLNPFYQIMQILNKAAINFLFGFPFLFKVLRKVSSFVHWVLLVLLMSGILHIIYVV